MTRKLAQKLDNFIKAFRFVFNLSNTIEGNEEHSEEI